MIDPEVRKSIWKLFQSGNSIAQLVKRFNVDRKTIKSIVNSQGEISFKKREDNIKLNENLLREVFLSCDGWARRTHEVLGEKGVKVGYSTLTRKIEKMGLNKQEEKRACKVPDVPGEESQQDTSPYTIDINSKKKRVVASQLYYRYSKRRYLKFYTSFTRFHMKCFFHESLNYFKYVCGECIIDNTNLAVHHGTGKDAVFHDEMISFAKLYGFIWKAHAIKHSDRKAGVERSFWTVETNFFPGRSFTSMEDLNRQAFEWSEKHEIKPNEKTKIIPMEAFETEKTYMKKVLPDLPAPYIVHCRVVDQYGYIAFDSNYYWIPLGTEKEVKILQYAEIIKVYSERKLVVEYALPIFGVRSEKFTPKGIQLGFSPKKVAIPSTKEEEILKNLGEEIGQYLQHLIKGTSTNRKYQVVKRLHSLHCRLTPSLFLKAVTRSLKYNLYDIKRLEEISIQILKSENLEIPDLIVNHDYENRENYQEGETTDDADLACYEDKYGSNTEKKTDNGGLYGN
jgi:hypothetical protein